MSEFILSLFLLASIYTGLFVYYKERRRREEAEFRLGFIINRAAEAYAWCAAEFPQIGHTALFISAFDAKHTYVKQSIDSTHNGSVDQFRQYMRRWFKHKG